MGVHKGIYLVLVFFVFLIGVSLGIAMDNWYYNSVNIDTPQPTKIIQDIQIQKEKPIESQQLLIERFINKPQHRDSPFDRIKESNIKVYNQRVTIDVDNAIIAKFTDTKSMEPVISKDANAIEIIPKSFNDIQPGDIVSYKSSFSDAIIIHRVIEKGIDEKGIYFKIKGDNLDYTDPEKIRFEQIKRVVVGILY